MWDNFITGSSANIEHLAGNENYRFVRHDVSNHIFLPGEIDYIFHFASPASPIDYLEHPIPTLKVGSLGTHNALGLAKAKGAVSCSPPRANATATRSSIRRRRITGAT